MGSPASPRSTSASAAVTVNVVDPTTAPLVALIVEVPTFTAVAKPAALIVAFAGVPDAHVTLPVRFCVELSLNVPVAVNCCVMPAAPRDSPASQRSMTASPPSPSTSSSPPQRRSSH